MLESFTRYVEITKFPGVSHPILQVSPNILTKEDIQTRQNIMSV